VGYIGMCSPKGCGLSAVLLKNRVSILAILVTNRVWFCTLVLNGYAFQEEATFSSLSIRPSPKARRKLCLGQLCQPQWP